jgi:Fungal specific transcription factor domain
VTALDDEHPLLTNLGFEPSASANIKSLAERYRSAAMKCLSADQFLWQHTLHTVQALILLIYAINHAHGPSWALLGTTFNISVAIGCHIDPSHLNLGPVESEIRRRCWASLMMLYTIQNTCLGNIAPQKFLAQVNLPADLDDEDIIDQANRQTNNEFENLKPPTKMSYILYKFRLYQIAAQICESTQGGEPDFNNVFSLESRISSEEEEHSARFSNNQNLPVYHLAHHLILKNYTNHLRLILHRPYLHLGFESSDGSVTPSDVVLQSWRRCKRSAITVLENHEQLYHVDAFRPYRWYIYGLGSFHAFLAASTLITLLSTDCADTTYSKQSSTLSLLHKCHRRFQEMAPRSEICAKAAASLARLLQSSSAPDRGGAELYQGRQVAADGDTPSVANLVPSVNEQSTYASSSSSSDAMLVSQYHFNSCLPQLQNLVQLPAAQWLGAPSAFTWSDWNLPLDSPLAIHLESGSFPIGTGGML